VITALFADVHSNLPALEACLRHAREQRATQFAFLGDLIGYGPDPAAVINVVRSVADAIVIKGNHDDAIQNEPKTRDLNDVAYDVITWTRNALNAEQRDFLASLPLIVRKDDVCYVHSSADQPAKWEYIGDNNAARQSMDAAATSYVFSGHVHEQVLYFKTQSGKTAPFRPISGSPVPVPPHRNWLAIAGSVGQPRDGNPASAYAIFDSESEGMTFFRVPYDHLETARRIRAARLPEMLAERIERGV
jgi:diadenosine tetraphosphatase ApaH/serine/threonine PP2A family protein phosphatase